MIKDLYVHKVWHTMFILWISKILCGNGDIELNSRYAQRVGQVKEKAENSNKPRGSRKLILFLAMLSIITPVQNLSRITNPIFTEYLVHTQHCAAHQEDTEGL